jgi:hypothetical protein
MAPRAQSDVVGVGMRSSYTRSQSARHPIPDRRLPFTLAARFGERHRSKKRPRCECLWLPLEAFAALAVE